MTEHLINDPLKDMCDGLDWLMQRVMPAQVQLTIAKDNAIATALAEIQPLWTKQEVARRCVLVRSVGSEVTTLFVDGIAAIVFQPEQVVQEWKDDKLVVTFTQRFQRVRAVPAQAANS